METKERINKIRKIIKGKCKTLSVKGGRGTATGWIEISGSGAGGEFTDTERKVLTELGISYGANYSVMDYGLQLEFLDRVKEYGLNNEEILHTRMEVLNKIKTPRVGDYLIDGKKVSRITHIWEDENGEIFQLQDGGGEHGQFYLDHGFVSYSGSLDSGVNLPEKKIIKLKEKKEGKVWFFSGDIWGAGRGVDFYVPFRVYKVADIEMKETKKESEEVD